MIHSVHDVLSTRLCAARDCANDAENGWALCTWCERRRARGLEIPLHVIPENVPDTLRCCVCGQFKPDDDFAHSSHASHRRRYRHPECRACGSKRRHQQGARRPRTPAQKTRRAIRDKERRAQLKAHAELEGKSQVMVEPAP